MIRFGKKLIEVFLYIVSVKEDGYHVFMDATVSGKRVKMLLDTGASRTVLDKDTLMRLHEGIEMEVNQDMAAGLGSAEIENFITLVDLEMGGPKSLLIPQWQVGVLDLSIVNESYSRIGMQAIAGVIGSDILVTYGAVVDYKKKKLYLEEGL